MSVLLAVHTTTASAQSRADEAAPEPNQAPAAQALYKGVVGNLLEAVPIDSESRVQLQRFSAVVGSPLSGHSLAMTLGIASPPLMILGFIWGLWSAKQIQPGGPQIAETGEPRFAAPHLQDRTTVAGHRSVGTPQLAEDPAAALDSLMRRADTSALATVVGGASSTDRLVPCENCIMPMLYFRPAPDVR